MPAIERVLRRDRAIVVVALITLSLLAWSYVVRLSFGMGAADSPMAGHAMPMALPNVAPWRVDELAFTFAMWAVMMVAMMTPAAAPLIAAFGALDRRRARARTAVPATAAMLAGYLIAWLAFSVAATALQWALHTAGLLSPHIMQATPVAGGIVLILAGGYQFTPLKHTCLARCRSPLDFLVTEWRDGAQGALVMGVRHGGYCVGCCWALMLVLFAAGVMNLLWVAAIALYVLIEKALPAGRWLGRPAGALMVGWGAWLLAGALMA
jgi:predicted metal-binding membrane protein